MKIMTASLIGAQHWASAFLPFGFGGADRDRTGDLLLAKQALSQLSYSPHNCD
jgi:hypothetical protein